MTLESVQEVRAKLSPKARGVRPREKCQVAHREHLELTCLGPEPG